MRPLRLSSISLVALLLVFVLPEFAHAATASFFGPIVSDACYCLKGSTAALASTNSAPAWGCILATFQNVISLVVSLATVAITIFIALAGYTYMTSGGSAEKRSLANKRILNAVIGLVIVLCAWLLVNSILLVLYNPSAPGFLPWNSILGQTPAGSNPDCLTVVNPPSSLPQLLGATNGTGGNAAAAPAATPASNTGTGACNASSVQSAAVQGGVQMSSTEAATLACIAGPESGCGALNQNYNWDGAKSSPPSTAWGPFQMTLKGNSNCFNNSACSAAAGVSGPLNCKNAFDSNGYSIPGQLLTECQTAAANLSCSAVAADCNIQANNGSYSAWTGNSDSTAAHQACVATNSGT